MRLPAFYPGAPRSAVAFRRGPLYDGRVAQAEGAVRMDDRERALGLLGPLEARIMRLLWSGAVASPFVVRDVAEQLADLAYTTVMTTVRRLAEKGPLTARAVLGRKAIEYELVLSPAEFLAAASRQEAAEVVARYGDAALAAFAARLDALTPDQRARLEQLRGQP